jgi:predicted MFS family arabinose efflux permease
MEKPPQIWILAFLFSLANVLGVMFVTALPALSHYFQITKAEAQGTISVYLIGCVVAQVVYPALTKAFGRKPSIYIGGALAILGAILCLVSLQIRSFFLLLLGRWLMAFGAACGAILVSTMVGESFSVIETRKKFSHLMSSFIVFPSVGVMIGGFLTRYISWESCFTFMLLYAIFVVGLCSFLPETAKTRSVGHLHVFNIARAYFEQFSKGVALLYGLIIACASIFLYVFSAEAPFIAESDLNMSAAHFGLYNLIPNLGFFIGGAISARLIHKITARVLVLVGICGFFLFSLLMFFVFDLGFVNTITLFGMPALIFMAAAFILPNGQACALARSEDKPYMSSLLYVIQYLWVALSIIAIRFLPAGDSSVLPMVYTGSGVLMIVLWLIVRKFHGKSCS